MTATIAATRALSVHAATSNESAASLTRRQLAWVGEAFIKASASETERRPACTHGFSAPGTRGAASSAI
jgi:hypothetical protein